MTLREPAELATDPSTASDQLDALSGHPEAHVRRLVAGNPSTSLASLLVLLEEFPEQVLANAALDLHRMAHPTLLTRAAPVEQRVRWARTKGMPGWVLGQLIGPGGRSAAGGRPGGLVPLQDLLDVEEREQWVRSEVARNPSCPRALLEQLMESGQADAVAANPACPADLLARLLLIEEERGKRVIRSAVASNPGAPAAMLEALANEGTEVSEAVARNPSCPPAVLDRLAGSAHDRTRIAVFTRDDCLPELRRRVLDDPDGYVRDRVAAHAGTPDWLLSLLSADDYVFVRVAVARNPSSPPDVLAALARDEEERVRIGVAVNPRARATRGR